MSTLPKRNPAASMLAAALPLEEVTRIIVEGLDPRRVVLFGSRARGDARPDSDYDVMVEIDDELDSRHARDAVYDLFRNGTRSVDILVYTSAEVRRWRDDVGFVLYDIVREGRVLYSRSDVADGELGPSASLPAPRVRERPGPPPESLRAWLDRAREDFALMEAAQTLAPPALGGVCLHAHQSAEKLLKACLIARLIRPPPAHDLGELRALCMGAGLELEHLRAPCDTLVKLWPRSRYPEAGVLTGADARAAAEAAGAIRSALLPLVR